MSRLAIITARGGSKRIPRKNIKEFCGKPIIAYSIEAALKSRLFDEVMVSTDDVEIAGTAIRYGAVVPFYRSEATSNDYATTGEVLIEVLSEYEKRGKVFDTFACIYPCAPFITPEKLREAFEILENTDADSVSPVVQFSYPPQRSFVIRDGSLTFQYPEYKKSRSQDLEPIYHDIGQYYAYKTEIYRGRVKGSGKTYPVITPEETVQDIDNESDWKLAEIKYRAFVDNDDSAAVKKGKKVVAVIQAHMSSTRLPGKIMKEFCGEPALYRMIERVRHSRYLDDIVIATSTLPCDDVIVEACEKWGVHTARGSDSDVLSRYWVAAQQYPAEVYMRMTSDCPLIDPDDIDAQIKYFFENGFRYVHGDGKNPLGIGGEVFSAELLKEAYENSVEDYEHEHVTPYMYWKQDSVGCLPSKRDGSMFRITLDTQADYELIEKVYEALYKQGNYFTLNEIEDYLEANPEIAAINSEIVQKTINRKQ